MCKMATGLSLAGGCPVIRKDEKGFTSRFVRWVHKTAAQPALLPKRRQTITQRNT